MNPRHMTRENSMVISVATPDFWAIPGTNNIHLIIMGFSGGSDSKESTCNVGDLGLTLGWEDPLEEGMATHFSILAWKIPMDRGAWWAIVYGVSKSRT